MVENDSRSWALSVTQTSTVVSHTRFDALNPGHKVGGEGLVAVHRPSSGSDEKKGKGSRHGEGVSYDQDQVIPNDVGNNNIARDGTSSQDGGEQRYPDKYGRCNLPAVHGSEVYDRNGIKREFTPVSNPEFNGVAERALDFIEKSRNSGAL